MELMRVPSDHRDHVDQALREVARRLLAPVRVPAPPEERATAGAA